MRPQDLFQGTCYAKPPRNKPRIMAHVIDAGVDWIRYQCPRCDWDSGWVANDLSVSQNRKGIPCVACNGDNRGPTQSGDKTC